MRFIESERAASRAGEAGIAPYLTALMIATGLLIVWAALRAI